MQMKACKKKKGRCFKRCTQKCEWAFKKSWHQWQKKRQKIGFPNSKSPGTSKPIWRSLSPREGAKVILPRITASMNAKHHRPFCSRRIYMKDLKNEDATHRRTDSETARANRLRVHIKPNSKWADHLHQSSLEYEHPPPCQNTGSNRSASSTA